MGSRPLLRRTIGILIALGVALAAFAFDWRDPHAIDLAARLQPPGVDHLLGTDQFGRDLWARVAVGGRRSLIVLAVVLSISVTVGVAIGVAAALASGAREIILLRAMQFAAAAPRLIVALALTSVTGLGPVSAGLAMALTGWSRYALVAHGLAREGMQREHWRAALALGVHPARAASRHLLPTVAGPLRAFAGADGARIIVTFASLAFLGLGADTGAPDWGAMVWEYRLFLFEAPRLPLAPLGAIVLLALALQLTVERRPRG